MSVHNLWRACALRATAAPVPCCGEPNRGATTQRRHRRTSCVPQLTSHLPFFSSLLVPRASHSTARLARHASHRTPRTSPRPARRSRPAVARCTNVIGQLINGANVHRRASARASSQRLQRGAHPAQGATNHVTRAHALRHNTERPQGTVRSRIVRRAAPGRTGRGHEACTEHLSENNDAAASEPCRSSSRHVSVSQRRAVASPTEVRWRSRAHGPG